MQKPSPETGPMEEWECEGSGYGIGWVISTTKNNLRAVRHNGGSIGVSTALALVPEENLAVAILSNTNTEWRGAILIGILRTLLPDKLKDFPAPVDEAAKKSQPTLDKELVGLSKGHVHTYERERFPLSWISGPLAVYTPRWAISLKNNFRNFAKFDSKFFKKNLST